MEARILIIDNDESMREMLTVRLQSHGWQVVGYAYAGLTRVALEQYRPSLIIVDFDFKDGNGTGWALLQLLKMDDATAHIPVLVTRTAYDLSAEVKGYLLSRSINVVLKPIDPDAFLALIQTTLTLADQAGALHPSDRLLPILIVDDTEDLLDSMAMVFQLEGYAVVTAPNGRVALDMVSQDDYCLILLDLAMPVMNGLEFLSAYEQQVRPHTPVIVLSANADLATHVFPSFVVGVMAKPFSFKALLEQVRKYAIQSV